MIGNVWEWVRGNVKEGIYEGVEVPSSGYVSAVDGTGFALTIEIRPNKFYFSDKLWTDSELVTGIFRGGYWKSKRDGGIYSVHAGNPPSFVGSAVGFRCVSNLQTS